jgi:hypothetical protein
MLSADNWAADNWADRKHEALLVAEEEHVLGARALRHKLKPYKYIGCCVSLGAEAVEDLVQR